MTAGKCALVPAAAKEGVTDGNLMQARTDVAARPSRGFDRGSLPSLAGPLRASASSLVRRGPCWCPPTKSQGSTDYEVKCMLCSGSGASCFNPQNSLYEAAAIICALSRREA